MSNSYKVVYSLISSEQDIYLAQLFVSSYSLKLHNPDLETVLVCDQDTCKSFTGSRFSAISYIDKVIAVDVPEGFSQKQKSRWLKTQLRNFVDGNFLTIDSDTIICDKLDFPKCENMDILAVLDFHAHLVQGFHATLDERAKKIGWNITSKDSSYFNSGVIFARDSFLAHEFYNNWHKNWLRGVKHGLDLDQPALGLTNQQMGYVVGELPGVFNCQILCNGLPFLASAKIIHYFNTITAPCSETVYYFSNPGVFVGIINNEYVLTDEIKTKIVNPTSLIPIPNEIVIGSLYDFIHSDFGTCLYYHYCKKGLLYKIVIFIVNFYNWVASLLK